MGRTNVSPALLFRCMLVFLLAMSLLPFQTKAGKLRSLSVEEELEGSPIEPRKKENWLKRNCKTLAVGIAKLIPIPKLGTALGTVVETAFGSMPEENKWDMIHFEFEALNARLDFFNEELKWASTDFQVAMGNIAKAWLKYSQMMKNDKVLENIFVPFYSQFVNDALVLHNLLIQPDKSQQSLGDVLAKKLRCHEKDVEAHFLYLNKLICWGNTMDEQYYTLKGVNSGDRKKISSEIASEAAQALFESHQRCVSNSKLYIMRDVLERIDDSADNQDIAKTIWTFLDKTYDRYEWLVVAFTTHKSKKMGRNFKRHILAGFTEIQRGMVTVAVVGQVKGNYDHVKDVKKAIDKCLQSLQACTDIDKHIQKCEEKVLNQDLAQTISAIHIHMFTGEDKSESYTQAKHIYTRECIIENGEINENGISDRVTHTFDIVIKSNEEITCKVPGDKLNCENGGTPEFAPLTYIAMCKCPYPFYGERCVKSFEHCDPATAFKRPLSGDRRASTGEIAQRPSENTLKRSNSVPIQGSGGSTTNTIPESEDEISVPTSAFAGSVSKDRSDSAGDIAQRPSENTLMRSKSAPIQGEK